MLNTKIKESQEICLDERSVNLREQIIKSVISAGRGHIGGAFSSLEILRVLYDDILNYDPKDPRLINRDRFILSKGHSCLALYVLLAEKGFFPKSELSRCFKTGAMLGGHPERDKIPGVEASTGSLGHGLSIGVGLALAAKIQKRSNKIYVLLGDGEINEGSVWEAAMAASKHKLDNLIAMVDYNKVQSAGSVDSIMSMEPMLDKWTSFGFETIEVNGHDISELKEKLSLERTLSKPLAIICHTVKGKGINEAEGNPEWHYKRVDESLGENLIKQLKDAL
mgnify:FL=1